MARILDMKFLQSRNLLRSCEFAAAGLFTVVVVLLNIRFCWSTGPLWRDEVCSFHVATMPTLKESWHLLAFENQPVVHYLVLRAWCALGFGATDFGLRALGLVISTFLISALWFSCWLINKSTPLWPLAMFALNQHTLRADSLRPHGLALVWIVLVFAFTWQLTFQPQPKKRTIFLAMIAAVLSVQTVFLNALLLGAICAASVVVSATRKAWRNVVWIFGIGLAAALSLLPYLPTIQLAQQWNGIRAKPNTFGSIASFFVYVFTMDEPVAGIVFLLLILGLSALAIVPALRRRVASSVPRTGDHFLFAAIVCLAGAIGTGGFLWVLKFPLQDRYYLPLMAVIALSLTVMTAALRTWTAVRLVNLLGSVILAAAFLRDSSACAKMRLTNCDLAAAAVAQRAETDDVIILSRFAFGITFQRYYRGSARWRGIPDISDYSLFRWDLVKQAMMDTDPMHELLVRIELALRLGHNVFVVGQFGPIPVAQPKPTPPAPLTTYGWDMDAYIARWSEQVSYLIDQHARNGQSIPLPANDRVDPNEKINVYIFSGWR